MAKSRTSIAYATFILMVGAITSKLLGFMRELIVAYKFGAGNISDAFLLTSSIPNLLFGAIATVVGISYIPYCQTLNKKEKIDYFTSNLTNCIIIILLAGCILVNIFPRLVLKILAGGLNSESADYAVVMIRIVVFSIIPIIMAHLFQAYSQVNEQFHSTAWFGVVTNTIIILFTLTANNHTFYLLSIGVVTANIIGMLMTIKGTHHLHFRYSIVLNPFDQDIKKIVVLTIPLLVENLAYNMSLLVDRSLASYLDSGTISGLSYAGTIGNIASGMISSSIITAVYPTISRLASKEKKILEPHLIRHSKWIVFILCPISFVFVFFAPDFVSIIFNHGAFKNASLGVIWQSLICYSIGAVPAGLQTYFIRCFYAFRDTKSPVFIQVFSFIINIMLNLLSVKYFRHMGIALSTSISYLIAFILLAIILKRKHNVSCVNKIIIDAISGCLNAFLAGIGTIVIVRSICIDNFLWRFIFEVSFFAMIYIGLAWVIQRETIKIGLDVIIRKIHKFQ